MTIFVSLHYFTDYPVMMKELVRILKIGGYLFIREHDVSAT